jgi:quercetin dioxygenase-like cupin family protein
VNIKDLHKDDKPVSAISLFKGDGGNATSIRILKDQKLKEHITQIPALLVCIAGNVFYEDEKGLKEELQPGDYTLIEPMVKHWVQANIDSHLVLVK